MSFLDNGTIRIGVDLNLGGAITWFSESPCADSSAAAAAPSAETRPAATQPADERTAPANLVNSWDWGRQIQMSHYSGPVPYTPDGKQPAPQWRRLGWNPVQAGDHFGHQSKVSEHRNDGKTIFVECIPMQWPLDNVPADCRFQSTITLDGRAARVMARLINARADKTQYPARGQELPAIYTNGPWWRLFAYTGDKPYSGAPLTQLPPRFPWTTWQATESWAALVDDAGRGIGVWAPGVHQFGGGFAGKPGAGGPKDPPTGYVTPIHSEILDHDIVYDYHYELILGTLDEIRRHVYDHTPESERSAPPTWRFDDTRRHWTYHDAVDAGWPIRGELDVHLTGSDPYLVSPPTFWRADDAPVVRIEAAFIDTGPEAGLFWRRYDAPGFTQPQSLSFTIHPDGQYRTYDVRLANSPEYHGAITALRLDPTPTGNNAARIRIRSVSLVHPTPH